MCCNAGIPLSKKGLAKVCRNVTCNRDCKGAVLPLVLGILLAVTSLMAALLNVPGGLRRISLMHAQKQQAIYDAESALLAYLAGLPADYFEQDSLTLPHVVRGRLGPWADLSAKTDSFGELHVLAGITCDSMVLCLESNATRREILEGFKSNLEREILLAEGMVVKSGNRRFLGRAEMMSLRIESGDLSLDLEGATSVANFWVDGSAVIRGNALFDTLRIYAKGPIEFRGRNKVLWLEAFSEDRVDVSQNFEFSGVLVARTEVSMGKDVVAHYPSFMMPLPENSEVPYDSILIPDFIDGPLKPFAWSIR